MTAEPENGMKAGSGSPGDFRYNAFISYRRTPHDTLVAREVQHSLERFRLPAGIRKKSGKDRIDRIFRDQEELEITADLSGRIERALESSEFLIVICSPEYSQSPWCLHELETFLRLRGHDHVLCVLSAGEPPSVFPDELLHRVREATAEDGRIVTVDETVEPLACDYRGSFRSARRTELPRLAAAMLGCSYDELVMRKEKYRRRKLAAVLTAAAAAAALAISYLIWSNAQISRNYRQAQISESRLLASESLEAFENQDRLTAVSNGLQALIGDDPARPVTEEAQFALTRATYAYETPSQMLETWRVDLNSDITEFFISRDGSVLVCMDQTGEFYSYDIRERKLLSHFRVAENTVPSAPIEGIPGQLLCYAGGEVVCADYGSGETLWREPMNYAALGAVMLSPQGDLIAVADSYAVWVLTTDQVPYAGLLLPEKDQYITDLCWSADGSRIAVKLKKLWEDQVLIGVFTIETGAFQTLDCSFGSIDSFCFDQDGCLYVLGDNRVGESDSHDGTTVLIPISFELRAYRNEELLWSQMIGARTLADSPVLEVTEESEKRIFLALGNGVYIFNSQGNPIGYLELREDVVKLMDIRQATFGFITDQGEQGTGWAESGIIQAKKTFPDGIRRVDAVPNRHRGEECFAVFSSGNLCIYESVSDENIQLFPDDGFARRPEGLLRSGENAVLLSDRTLLFYDLTAGEQTGRADLPAEDAFVLLTAIDKYAYVMRIHGDAGELSVLCFDLGSAMQVREMTLPVFDYYCASGLQKAPYSHEEAMFLTAMYRAPSPIAVCGEDLFAHDLSDNSIWRLCLTSGELTEIPVVLPEEAASFNLTYEERGFLKPSPLALSPDGKLLFTAATDPESGNRAALLVSPADGAVTLLPGTPHDLSSVAFAGDASGSADSVLFAGLHELYACSAEGMPLSEISWSGDNPVSFTAYAGKIFCVFPDERLRIYQGTTEILSVPLTFNLQNAMVSGRDFRYVFTEDRLYLYCGADLNVISLDGNANTTVFSAACVLDNLNDRKSLLQFSMEPQKQLPSGSADSAESGLFHLAAVSEYSPAELAARALAQLDAFEPEQSG